MFSKDDEDEEFLESLFSEQRSIPYRRRREYRASCSSATGYHGLKGSFRRKSSEIASVGGRERRRSSATPAASSHDAPQQLETIKELLPSLRRTTSKSEQAVVASGSNTTSSAANNSKARAAGPRYAQILHRSAPCPNDMFSPKVEISRKSFQNVKQLSSNKQHAEASDPPTPESDGRGLHGSSSDAADAKPSASLTLPKNCDQKSPDNTIARSKPAAPSLAMNPDNYALSSTSRISEESQPAPKAPQVVVPSGSEDISLVKNAMANDCPEQRSQLFPPISPSSPPSGISPRSASSGDKGGKNSSPSSPEAASKEPAKASVSSLKSDDPAKKPSSVAADAMPLAASTSPEAFPQTSPDHHVVPKAKATPAEAVTTPGRQDISIEGSFQILCSCGAAYWHCERPRETGGKAPSTGCAVQQCQVTSSFGKECQGQSRTGQPAIVSNAAIIAI